MSLGSGIRNKPIPDPGVKKAPDPGSGYATLTTGSLCLVLYPPYFYEKRTGTYRYEGSCSMSDLGSPLGLTSPSLSARLSRAS
jgi:hypothetical protein